MNASNRGFSLIELMSVIATIGITGSLAAMGMSDQIIEARAKSESLSLIQKLRIEHRGAKERMKNLRVIPQTQADGGVKLTFRHPAPGKCTDGDLVDEVVYKNASLQIGNASELCFKETGELVRDSLGGGGGTGGGGGGTPAIEVVAITKRGRVARYTLRVDRTGFTVDSVVPRGVTTPTGADLNRFADGTSPPVFTRDEDRVGDEGEGGPGGIPGAPNANSPSPPPQLPPPPNGN